MLLIYFYRSYDTILYCSKSSISSDISQCDLKISSLINYSISLVKFKAVNSGVRLFEVATTHAPSSYYILKSTTSKADDAMPIL